MEPKTIPFDELSMQSLAHVGGKNASLGEMIQTLSPMGIRVPDGFAITVSAYQDFLSHNNLRESLTHHLDQLDAKKLSNLSEVGRACRNLILQANLPETLKNSIQQAHDRLREALGRPSSFAVRSSATAEDSPKASFAGQHDSYLNIDGLASLLLAVQNCYASFFNDRAIKYRIDHNFSHMQVGLSVGVQAMVRSDKGSAGVAFTIEPETGNPNLIYITGAWGLGESVVQGAVNTDEFFVFKPALQSGKQAIVYQNCGDKQQMMIYGDSAEAKTIYVETPARRRDQFVLEAHEVSQLADWCNKIEGHYGMPMDIEWAKDGISHELYIVQARPETIHAQEKGHAHIEYTLDTTEPPLLQGKAIGRSIIHGRACLVRSLADSAKVQPGDIIVADITNPDWNALLRKAIGIVTNKGGRTSHASIVARELGIPAVVGTLNATEALTDGQQITVSSASGDLGLVYDGKLPWQEQSIPLDTLRETKTKAMFILADPQKALLCASYPNQGVGLLRLEFMINNTVQVHPMALVHFNDLPDGPDKRHIEAITRHYLDKKQYFIDTLAQAIALVAAAFYPKPVIVRMSDFKTNEYAKLLGGQMYEPHEENPMIGFRGASRYYNPRYRAGFGLECAAIRKVREHMGLDNVKVMIPFCRTIAEAKKVLAVMAENGLQRGVHDLQIYVMAEVPSNIILAQQFAALFDGFSIGSNDLTQLTLGLDRDSAIVSDLFDENNEAITRQIQGLVATAHEAGVQVGLCGQAPSDYPEFAAFLVRCGIDSISFNPDAMIRGLKNILQAELE